MIIFAGLYRAFMRDPASVQHCTGYSQLSDTPAYTTKYASVIQHHAPVDLSLADKKKETSYRIRSTGRVTFRTRGRCPVAEKLEPYSCSQYERWSFTVPIISLGLLFMSWAIVDSHRQIA